MHQCSLRAAVQFTTEVRVVGFAFETLLANGIIRKRRRQNLDRNSTIEPRVALAKHFAHAARAQRRDNLIRTKLVPGG